MEAMDVLIAEGIGANGRVQRCLAHLRTFSVQTYEQAVQALSTAAFQVVVIDLSFGESRALDLFEQMRSSARFDAVPVLFVKLTDFTQGIANTFERVMRRAGARALIDLHAEGVALEQALQRLSQTVESEIRGQAGRAAESAPKSAGRLHRAPLEVASPAFHHAPFRPAILAIDVPGTPPSRATVYTRTLERASEVIGGIDRLAEHLRVPRSALVRWMSGIEAPPLDVFLNAVDVVLLGVEPGSGNG